MKTWEEGGGGEKIWWGEPAIYLKGGWCQRTSGEKMRWGGKGPSIKVSTIIMGGKDVKIISQTSGENKQIETDGNHWQTGEVQENLNET